MGQVINGILIFGEINILYQGLPAILGYHPGRVLTDVKTQPTRCGRDIPKSIGPCWMPSFAEHLGKASLDVSFCIFYLHFQLNSYWCVRAIRREFSKE